MHVEIIKRVLYLILNQQKSILYHNLFMQLSANDRRSIIEELLEIRVFSTMNGLLKSKMTENKDEITEKKHSIELNEQQHDLKLAYLNTIKDDNALKIQKFETEKVR